MHAQLSDGPVRMHACMHASVHACIRESCCVLWAHLGVDWRAWANNSSRGAMPVPMRAGRGPCARARRDLVWEGHHGLLQACWRARNRGQRHVCLREPLPRPGPVLHACPRGPHGPLCSICCALGSPGLGPSSSCQQQRHLHAGGAARRGHTNGGQRFTWAAGGPSTRDLKPWGSPWRSIGRLAHLQHAWQAGRAGS
jgi:hypothetical protein